MNHVDVGVQFARILVERVAHRTAVDHEIGFRTVDDLPVGRDVLHLGVLVRFEPLLLSHPVLLVLDENGPHPLVRINAAAGNHHNHQTAVAEFMVGTAVRLLQGGGELIERLLHIVDLALDHGARARSDSPPDDIHAPPLDGLADQDADLRTAQLDGSHDLSGMEHPLSPFGRIQSFLLKYIGESVILPVSFPISRRILLLPPGCGRKIPERPAGFNSCFVL